MTKRLRTSTGRLGQALIAVAILVAMAGYALFRRAQTKNDYSPGGDDRRGLSEVVRVYTPEQQARRAGHLQILDPKQDGWLTEAMSEAAQAQIKKITSLWTDPNLIDPDRIAPLITNDFHCSMLRPSDLHEVYADKSIVVLRPAGASEPVTSERLHGAIGLADALRGLAQPLAKTTHRRAAVKTVRVQRAETTITTEHILEVFGQTATGGVEQHTRWHCQWSRSASGPPRLNSITLEDFEEVVTTTPHTSWFRDCTEAVIGESPAFRQQLAYGLNHWLARIETNHGMYIFAEYGFGLGDVNGDGLDDLYICQPGGLPNRLLIHNPDGTLTDRSESAGVDWLDHTSSALLVDLDNDGDQDLVLSIAHHLLLMGNDSKGRFQLEARLPISDRHVQSLSAVDYEADGDLDLYITVGFADEQVREDEDRSPFIYYDANEGGANVLLRNDITSGQWQFTDVTRDVGLDVNNRRHSLSAAWEDYDNDGDQDLYVANDYGQNCLYRNDVGTFTDITTKAGVVDYGSGMSVSWSDYDRDGDMDLYVANMFSSAGNRITRQTTFQENAPRETRKIFTRFAKGNTLFRNSGNGTFRDEGAETALEMGRWAFSSIFADLNNDGWDDVVVANGYITTEDTGDL